MSGIHSDVFTVHITTKTDGVMGMEVLLVPATDNVPSITVTLADAEMSFTT